MASKLCPMCCSETSKFKSPPKTCKQKQDSNRRACHECWEAHLSLQVEELHPNQIECLFCDSKISRDELKRLARQTTVVRYDSKLTSATRQRCQIRCPASISHGLQPHSREKDGRVFTCTFCAFRTCIDCDRPEHDNETCSQYRSRVKSNPIHLESEAATKAAYKCCPSCETLFVMAKGCGWVQCNACNFRFCSRCMIPWVGKDSAYLGGKAAHGEGCLYRTRDEESHHSLKRRFQPDEETQARLDEREEVRRQKREAKRQKR